MKQNSTVKQQSLNPQRNVRANPQPAVAERLDERVLAALHAAAEKKALEPIVLDLREIASFTDYFVILSGANERQVQAISDEGYKTAEWILLDYGDFVVHVFEQKARKFYDLERLWRESKRVELPAEFTADGA